MMNAPHRAGEARPAYRSLLAALTVLLALPTLSAIAGGTGGGFLPTQDRIAGSFRAPEPDNYNARFDPAIITELSKSGASIARSSVTISEQAAFDALSARVPELRVQRDEITQFPVMVLSYEPGTMLATPSRKAGQSPEASAREFLSTNKSLFGVNDADLATLKVRYVTSPEGGATIAKFDQIVDGLPVFDAEFAVAMTKTNQVAATSGRFYGGTAEVSKTATVFAISATDAIARGIKDLTGREIALSDLAQDKPEDVAGYMVYGFVPDRSAGDRPFLSEGTRIRKMLFPLASGRFIPCYYLELWVEGQPAGSGPVFSYVISAEDGRMLFRNNLRQYDAFNYKVYADTGGDKRPWDGPTGTVGTPHPTGTPNQFQAPFISAQFVSVESLLTPSDPWLPSGATATTGNNTDAYLDITGANGFSAGDVRGATSTAGTFDYQYNSTLNVEDATNRQAAVVGMFYQVNWLHDVWYQHGFTEGAGNAQTDNFGRGGLGNDSLLAEGQDQSGLDNANMSTPADGGKPRMQMYKFTAGGLLNPSRDGTFDMLIVGHEMGHYISNRLIGNGSGLGNKQGGSMGEGWGDFNCVLSTAQDNDNVDGTYAVGGQTDRFFCGATFNDNYYYSIRRYPYSSLKTKNPFTFKDIGSGITTYPGVSGNPCLNLTSQPSEVHNSGEIWAEMLWQCYAELAHAYGVPTARAKIYQYMIDGMKMTPANPTFGQARDGVIASANAANGFANPKDAQILWKAFSKRGIGANAVSPASSSSNHAGVVEDFTAAPGLPDDTIGIFLSGNYFERDVLFGGQADTTVSFGVGGTPLMGNWDGGATVGAVSADNPGFYDAPTGVFFLRNSQTPGPADVAFGFGPPNSVPLVGDWNGDGTTTIGIYIPATGAFFLRNSNSPGSADITFTFGPSASTLVPVAGDWNNDGTDTIGLYDPATGFFFLRNSNTPGAADLTFSFGPGGAGFTPLAGDWNSDGTDTIGIYSSATGVFFLRNANTSGIADETIGFGPGGAGFQPIAGNFDGQ